MKYMIMMFGSAEEMTETQSPDWIREMIGFMEGLNAELRGQSASSSRPAGWPTAARPSWSAAPTTAYVVTDGPFAEAKESLVGYWVLDVADEQRVFDISGRIVKYSQVVEVRPSMDAPPDLDA